MSNYIRNKFLFEKRSGKDFTIDIDLSAFDDEPKKASKKSTDRKKIDPADISKLTTDFDASTFWTASRLERLNEFVTANTLNPEASKQMIEDLVAFDKQPIRSDVAKLMTPKPKLNEYETLVQPVINQIVAFANDLKNPEAEA